MDEYFGVLAGAKVGDMAGTLYLMPTLTVVADGRNYIGPKYFAFRNHPTGIVGDWAMMDYGFMPTALVREKNVAQADLDFLAAQTDVYVWPANLDAPITDPALDAFFEALSIPTDWLTPSTTYRQLLRSMAGLFQFAQKFTGLSGLPLFGDGVTLETNYRSTGVRETWIDQTFAAFGYPAVTGNPKLRSLAKQAGDAWGTQPFYLGGFEF